VILPGTIQPNVFTNLTWYSIDRLERHSQEREPLTVLIELLSNSMCTDDSCPVYRLQLSANESRGPSCRMFSL